MRRCINIVVFIILVAAFGCVQMRDYAKVTNSSVGVGMRHDFGKGTDVRKDYYVISGGDGIVIGDTKNEITKKIGLPDKVNSTFEGYERWTYTHRGVVFTFSGDRLIEWRELKDTKK